jgi:prephenate dehydratase
MASDAIHPEFSNKKYITSCIFKLKSTPAALYKALGGFATNGVNLCKLESFSVKNTFDQVNFYIDIEGHIEEASTKKALEELGFHTETLDVLGVYEADSFRFNNK